MFSMAKFKRGDVVTLNSGGSPMTVVGVYMANSDSIDQSIPYEAYRMKFGGNSPAFYCCSWFEKDKKKEDVFPEESLTDFTVNK